MAPTFISNPLRLPSRPSHANNSKGARRARTTHIPLNRKHTRDSLNSITANGSSDRDRELESKLASIQQFSQKYKRSNQLRNLRLEWFHTLKRLNSEQARCEAEIENHSKHFPSQSNDDDEEEGEANKKQQAESLKKQVLFVCDVWRECAGDQTTTAGSGIVQFGKILVELTTTVDAKVEQLASEQHGLEKELADSPGWLHLPVLIAQDQDQVQKLLLQVKHVADKCGGTTKDIFITARSQIERLQSEIDQILAAEYNHTHKTPTTKKKHSKTNNSKQQHANCNVPNCALTRRQHAAFIGIFREGRSRGQTVAATLERAAVAVPVGHAQLQAHMTWCESRRQARARVSTKVTNLRRTLLETAQKAMHQTAHQALELEHRDEQEQEIQRLNARRSRLLGKLNVMKQDRTLVENEKAREQAELKQAEREQQVIWERLNEENRKTMKAQIHDFQAQREMLTRLKVVEENHKAIEQERDLKYKLPLLKERTSFRAKERDDREWHAKETQRQARLQREQQRKARLDKVLRSVPYLDKLNAIERNAARATGETKSWMVSTSTNPRQDDPLFANHGFSDGQVTGSFAFRVSEALRANGLAKSAYGQEVLRGLGTSGLDRRNLGRTEVAD